MVQVKFRVLVLDLNVNLFCSQLCDEIDEHEKNSSDMIEEEKKKIPGKIILTKQYISNLILF